MFFLKKCFIFCWHFIARLKIKRNFRCPERNPGLALCLLPCFKVRVCWNVCKCAKRRWEGVSALCDITHIGRLSQPLTTTGHRDEAEPWASSEPPRPPTGGWRNAGWTSAAGAPSSCAEKLSPFGENLWLRAPSPEENKFRTLEGRKQPANMVQSRAGGWTQLPPPPPPPNPPICCFSSSCQSHCGAAPTTSKHWFCSRGCCCGGRGLVGGGTRPQNRYATFALVSKIRGQTRGSPAWNFLFLSWKVKRSPDKV